jgi:hypothetical protein
MAKRALALIAAAVVSAVIADSIGEYNHANMIDAQFLSVAEELKVSVVFKNSQINVVQVRNSILTRH